MRCLRFVLLIALTACGCKKSPSEPTSASDNTRSILQGPTPREVKASERSVVIQRSSDLAPLPKLPISGIFKPIAERTTDELLEEVMHFSTKNHLSLLAELANRSNDKTLIVAKMGLLQVDGRYHVRLTAANVAVVLDAENAGKHATTVSLAQSSKTQNPTYGPIIESSPELRGIQKRIVPQLVKLLERELAEAKLYEHSLGALTILGTFPQDIGQPAVGVVKKVLATPMHPNALFAKQTLKNWGIE